MTPQKPKNPFRILVDIARPWRGLEPCRRGFRFASDDQAARREAGRLGVGLTGTIGILAKAVRLRICDIKTADRYLAKMIAHGFYAPDDELLFPVL